LLVRPLILGRGDNRGDNRLDSGILPWEIPTMNATVTDSRRRLVMPPELPARSSVVVQQIDEDTWIVKRARPSTPRMVLLQPDIKQLPYDSEWQETEGRLVAHHSRSVAPFEE
jgi:hypothetical protein